MQFKVSKNDFFKAISTVIGGVSLRATPPILANILIKTQGMEQLEIIGMDLEIGIQTHCPAQVEQRGEITIQAKRIYDIVRELEAGEVEITVVKNSAVNITTKKSFFKINGLEADDFPKFPEPAPEQSFQLSERVLKECLALTVFACSRDETRHTLTGALLSVKKGHAHFVATDGKRLSFVEKKLDGAADFEMEVIIPTKTISELIKLLTDSEDQVLITRSQNQILFKLAGAVIASRLIEGRFPSYEQVIPKNQKTSTQIARQELLAALRRASLLTSQENEAVKLDFLNDRLFVSSRSPNLGEAKEEIEANVSGDAVTIGFNPAYLIDVLKNLEVENITFSITDPAKPGLILSESGYRYVVMPMQLT